MASKINIVGIGDDGLDGLTRQARTVIDSAEVIVGGRGLVDSFASNVVPGAKRVIVSGGLDEMVETLQKHADRRVVLLTGGDPLFYGIARYLTDTLGKDRFEVIPHVSSMQLAFARVKESWDDAYLTNLATQSLDRVVDSIRTADRVGLFTTEAISPSVVAAALLDRRIDYFTAYVCENLGTPDETVTQGDLRSIAGQNFSPLNVMVLVRKVGRADRPSDASAARLFGNPDDAFLQSRPKRGLLTPSEVRCIALAELDLAPKSVVWDVGAGSGSLAIEAARIAREGKVYGIEMDAEDYGLMVANAAEFDCPSLIPIHGRAPEAWADLPDPDAIFVGGTGRIVSELVNLAVRRLAPSGRIVVNVSSPDNLVDVQRVLEGQGLRVDVRMINIARGQYQMDRMRFEALNPTFLIVGVKNGSRF
jgi:precorrin-6B C5,15-methyltransferase / cobalt-precorrin-6B C5,C15-methyltransferase